ncbi:hypothetical protein QCA50_004842 [Cerrena zonata]|uniref:Uncharacterized protein n=1 Tax=Cerrena zonata TaxID=2478898 RepID=A0AAW0GML1_9APHY
MSSKSRVLISDLYPYHLEEYILHTANRENETSAAIQPAPAPLLPNYGAGKIRPYNPDLDMMVLFNS